MKSRSPVISLIGRPNVGKSSIFNRLMRKRGHKALTYDRPGVTRDRHYAIANIQEDHSIDAQDIILIDTGGFYPEKVEEKQEYDPFFNIMADQAKLAIGESDLVLFVVDVREGLLPFDEMIAQYLRESGKEYWLVINKYDTEKQDGDQYDFFALAPESERVHLVSAEHGRGIIDLREKLQNFSFSMNKEEDDAFQKGVKPRHQVVANLAIIGAPNVGKSTLLNQLTKSQRALVSDIAGTTVDPIEAYIDIFFGKEAAELDHAQKFRRDNMGLMEEFYQFQGEDDEELEADEIDLSFFERAEKREEEEDSRPASQTVDPYRSVKLVDTAGIRKNKLIKGDIEAQSVYRSLRSISEADIVIFMSDCCKGITHHDRRLMDIALDKGKSIIICVNKIDLINETIQNSQARKEWMKDLRAIIPWLDFCDIVPISAKEGSHLKALFQAIKKTVLVRTRKVPTSLLNKVMGELFERNPIMIEHHAGKRLKLKYASMLKASPPTFLLFTNKSKEIPDNFRKYLQNGIRRELKLVNSPIHLIFRTTGDIKKRIKKSQRFAINKRS